MIEFVLPKDEAEEARQFLAGQPFLDARQVFLRDKTVLGRLVLKTEECERVLDLLNERYATTAGYRVMVLPVEATLPEPEAPEEAAKPAGPKERTPERISRHKLYEEISNAARCTWVYLVMVLLSAVVAGIGLHRNSLAFIIGAMVIAPLLGPNVALALATTLGDLALARRAALTNLVGIGAGMALSLALGKILSVNPATPEVAARTSVGALGFLVALASGSAGALAFTTAAPAALIGVMVAVALLPPLVTFGLLLGSGHTTPAMGALLLFLTNLVCINLASVATFLAQGIHPARWWERDRAAKATLIALVLWALLLVALAVMIEFSRRT